MRTLRLIHSLQLNTCSDSTSAFTFRPLIGHTARDRAIASQGEFPWRREYFVRRPKDQRDAHFAINPRDALIALKPPAKGYGCTMTTVDGKRPFASRVFVDTFIRPAEE